MRELNIKKDSIIHMVMRMPMEKELCFITYRIGPQIHELKDQIEFIKTEMHAKRFDQKVKDRATKAFEDISQISDSIKNIA